jgi:hypothetical protein
MASEERGIGLRRQYREDLIIDMVRVDQQPLNQGLLSKSSGLSVPLRSDVTLM